ncbi:MAG: efflux RND transporter periplasmic adaptor subunit, partial [Prevotella sp.]|nr:efflux RND transporter periplasmic adaptor subunit [Prevotella sp.]
AVQERSDGELFVWTIDKDSTAHRTMVTIGSLYGNRVVILSGLTPGMWVVTDGYQKLSEGTKVVF